MESRYYGVVLIVELQKVVRNSDLKTIKNWLEQPPTNCKWTFYDDDVGNEAHDLAPLG